MSSSALTKVFELRLLGGFEARINGVPVAGIAYNTMRALLAYLAIEREQDHKREVLADLLWSGCVAATARGNLRRTLADLRRVLEQPTGAELFLATKQTIRFVPRAYVDVLDFVARAAALDEASLDLYQAKFLSGLSLPECPVFEDWMQTQREALHRRALTLLEKLWNRDMQAGNLGHALNLALRYVTLEPLNEDACRRLMRLYVMTGQPNAALQQYHACCAALHKELGVLPTHETQELAQRISQGEVLQHETTAMQAPVMAVGPRSFGERRTMERRAVAAEERIQVSVMHCELTLVGPGKPADLDACVALLAAPQARCMALVKQFSGYSVQSNGGSFLAYFGYPLAIEETARKAVQAALAITQPDWPGVEVRASVHTGMVIAGGQPLMLDRVGETSQLAVQLLQMAATDKVVISQQTRDMVAGFFCCNASPVQAAFGVVNSTAAMIRLDTPEPLTPFAGRQAELALLMGWWQEARQGSHRVALVMGEPGLGKSRLVRVLQERLADQAHLVWELRCLPEFARSPFYPLIVFLEKIMAFEPEHSADEKFRQLQSYLQIWLPHLAAEAAPLLAQLLLLPQQVGWQTVGYTPQMQKEKTILTVLALLRAIAGQRPVLLVAEDLQWVDPSSLELLTCLVEQPLAGAVLGIFTARPEFDPPWAALLESSLVLRPLPEQALIEMVASMQLGLNASDTARIVARADGVPLFAEEMAKMAALNPAVGIPGSLRDLLTVQLHALGEWMWVAQLAATIGRRFSPDLLGRLLPPGVSQVAQALHPLQEFDVITACGDADFQFKQALMQEAAYQSQTRHQQQAAHAHIAQVLQADFADWVTYRPELLAGHLSQAGQTLPAIDYWCRAGQRAVLAGAHAQALAHFDHAQTAVLSLPTGEERDRLEFQVCLKRGSTLRTLLGYGAIEAVAAYNRAITLGAQLDDGHSLFQATWAQWMGSSSHTHHDHALELAQGLHRLAQQSGDLLQRQQAHYAQGCSLLWTGQFEPARDQQQQCLALYQPECHETMVAVLGENIHVAAGSQLSWVLCQQGQAEQARAISERMLALAHEHQHPYTASNALLHRAALCRWLGDVAGVAESAGAAVRLAQQHGFAVWQHAGMAFQGWAMVMQGLPEGLALLRQSVSAIRDALSGVEALFLVLLAQACLHQGAVKEAALISDDALNAVRTRHAWFLQAEALDLRRRCLE